MISPKQRGHSSTNGFACLRGRNRRAAHSCRTNADCRIRATIRWRRRRRLLVLIIWSWSGSTTRAINGLLGHAPQNIA